jgi:L-amino acid N-acyltransferase
MQSIKMLDAQIRPATTADLEAINDIYNHYVACATCTYQEEPETLESRRAWFASHGPLHPITVATAGDETVGWGSLSPFHERSAYRYTVENSVYVRHTHQRRGIGHALLIDLIARARTLGHHTIIAGVDADQAGSIALHEGLGFREAAHLREVGFRFDRWLHVRYLQLML